MILDVEHMFVSNQTQHKKWSILMSECFVEAEGPSFKYELMFSEERNHEVNIIFYIYKFNTPRSIYHLHL